ncbi:MAG: SDR family oxidoreductase [Bacteroidetes bacterium]|nr:SDR family oxidoreductase [Bacteroidota bacterium]
MKPTTISILGCGYVGYPLAKSLLSDQWRVRGSTTQESKLTNLLADGIEPYLLEFTPQLSGYGIHDFFDSDVVVINFPPGRKRKNVQSFMKEAMNSLLSYLIHGSVQKVVFISSTSVYSSGQVREEDAGKQPPGSPSGIALLAAENLLSNATDFETTILRFAGLYGYERSPGRFWSGRVLPNPENAVNMLHQDDAVGVIKKVIEKNCWGEVFNVCAEQHPSRAEFYTKIAQNQDIPPPEIQDGTSQPDKVVMCDKLTAHLGYQWIHPDPMVSAL